jgi:hypothetical protein
MATLFVTPAVSALAGDPVANAFHVSAVTIWVDPKTFERVFVLSTVEEPDKPAAYRLDAMTVAVALAELGRAIARSLH